MSQTRSFYAPAGYRRLLVAVSAIVAVVGSPHLGVADPGSTGPKASAVDAAEPLPLMSPAISSRIAALVENADTARQTCIAPDAFEALVKSSPGDTENVVGAAADGLRAMWAERAANGVAPPQSQKDGARLDIDTKEICQCLSSIAVAATAVTPKRAARIHQMIARIVPDCRSIVAAEIRQILADSLLEPGLTALSKTPLSLTRPEQPPVIIKDSTPTTSPETPQSACPTRKSCISPLPIGDRQIESPTKLGDRS